MPIYLQNTEKESTLNSALSDKVGTSTYYLTEDPTHYEIQRNNNFVFYVTGLNAKLSIVQNNYAQKNAEDVLKVSVASSSVPHFKELRNLIVIRSNLMILLELARVTF